MAAGLFRKLMPKEAARFSFLLSVSAIAGAVVFKAKEVASGLGGANAGPYSWTSRFRLYSAGHRSPCSCALCAEDASGCSGCTALWWACWSSYFQVGTSGSGAHPTRVGIIDRLQIGSSIHSACAGGIGGAGRIPASRDRSRARPVGVSHPVLGPVVSSGRNLARLLRASGFTPTSRAGVSLPPQPPEDVKKREDHHSEHRSLQLVAWGISPGGFRAPLRSLQDRSPRVWRVPPPVSPPFPGHHPDGSDLRHPST